MPWGRRRADRSLPSGVSTLVVEADTEPLKPLINKYYEGKQKQNKTITTKKQKPERFEESNKTCVIWLQSTLSASSHAVLSFSLSSAPLVSYIPLLVCVLGTLITVFNFSEFYLFKKCILVF